MQLNLQVVTAELGAIAERVDVLEVKVSSLDQILAKLDKAATRQDQYTLLQEFLEDFWSKFMGKRARKVEAEKFCQRVADWFEENRCGD